MTQIELDRQAEQKTKNHLLNIFGEHDKQSVLESSYKDGFLDCLARMRKLVDCYEDCFVGNFPVTSWMILKNLKTNN